MLLHQAWCHRVSNYEGAGDAVVRSDDFPALFGRHDALVVLEFLHWLLDAAKKLARPQDVAGDWGGVSHRGRADLLLVVHLLNRFQVEAVVVKDDGVLGVKISL